MPAYTTVATYLHPWEAEIARGLLESEGIMAILADENIVRMNWSHALAVGGVRLQVPPESVDAARSVLSRQRAGEFALPLEEEFGLPPAICKSCGSRNLQPTLGMVDSACRLEFLHCGHVSATPKRMAL
ncbi:MAG: DUF2007 domain-containing protein [Proteobacteria bacterium]|nr:DUF2007 domain-containing protein [Pseudomonadota bacterium]